MNRRRQGFTLLEMMAVVVIISIMVAGTSLVIANARPAVQVRKDAGSMVAFLRNMWDRSRATGSPLILRPNYVTGALDYVDPVSGQVTRADFSSDARVLAVRLNDRFYTANTYLQDENGVLHDVSLYISEGRGLTRVAVLFGIVDEDDGSLSHVHLAALNLITGKGGVSPIGKDQLAEVAGILAGG